MERVFADAFLYNFGIHKLKSRVFENKQYSMIKCIIDS